MRLTFELEVEEVTLLLVDETLELLEAGLVLVVEVFEEEVTALATVLGLRADDDEEVFLELDVVFDDELDFLDEDVTVDAFVVTTLTSVFKVVFAVVEDDFLVEEDFLVEDDFLVDDDFLVEVAL